MKNLGNGLIFIAFMIFLAFFTADLMSKTPEASCTWADKPMQIDGRTEDWANTKGVMLSEQNVMMTFCNDDQNLYVLFRTNDSRWGQAIRMTGLTLYFDPKGKKNKNSYIRLKDGPTMEQLKAAFPDKESEGGHRTPPQTGSGTDKPREQPASLTCYLKDSLAEKTIPRDGSKGPAAAFNLHQGFFIYEFRIPLARDSGYCYSFPVKPGQKISVGGIWGDMGEMPSRGEGGTGGSGGGGGGMPGGMGGQGGPPPGGGMGGPGGGPGGQGEPGGGGGRPEIPEKQEVWIKAALAAPPAPPIPQN